MGSWPSDYLSAYAIVSLVGLAGVLRNSRWEYRKPICPWKYTAEEIDLISSYQTAYDEVSCTDRVRSENGA